MRRYAIDTDEVMGQLEDAEPLIRDAVALFDVVVGEVDAGELESASGVLAELLDALQDALPYLEEALSLLPEGDSGQGPRW